MAKGENKIIYYFITDKGKSADLTSQEFFIEEKAILQYLEKQATPCSLFKIKMGLEEKKIDKSWQTWKKYIDKLVNQEMVGIREE